MKVSKRIKKLASLVEAEANVIDIGCDHALLDIYLTLYNKNSCIASDINEKALSKAKENIKKYEVDVEMVVSDGLNNIDIPENNIVVIAGMGTNTIINILSNDKVNNIDVLIVQTNNDLYKLRKFIIKKGFYIDKELGFVDKKIRYTQIKFKRGKSKMIDYNLGLIANKDEDTNEYLESLLNEKEKILNGLPKKYYLKKYKLKRQIKKIKQRM